MSSIENEMKLAFTKFCVLLLLAGYSAPGCLGGRDKLPMAALCMSMTDCEAGLVCIYGRCRNECTYDRDCPEGGLCLAADEDRRVCSVADDITSCLEADENCPDEIIACGDGSCWEICLDDGDCTEYRTHCVNDRCRPGCLSDDECPDGECVPSPELGVSVCAFPDELSPLECSPEGAIDSWTVAYYRMDEITGDGFRDETGIHDGDIEGTGEYSLESGASSECGEALHFSANAYGVIDGSDDAWDLSEGAIEFWFKQSEPVDAEPTLGILSRDGEGTSDSDTGHLSVFLDRFHRLVVRLQSVTEDVYACSDEVLDRDRWVHIGIKVGPPELELFIDGEKQSYRGDIVFFWDVEASCGDPTSNLGIAGNDRDWVVGALNLADPTFELSNPCSNCAFDELRISSIRRDFSRLSQ